MSTADSTRATGHVAIVEINREQRDVLWEDAAVTLNGTGRDLANAPEWNTLDYSLDIRRRVDAALWLLDDLGWRRDDPRDRFYLTMPSTTLRWWLDGLDEYAVDSLKEASNALADPVRGFRLSVEFGENLEDCIAEARQDCDTHLERHLVCRDVLALVSS